MKLTARIKFNFFFLLFIAVVILFTGCCRKKLFIQNTVDSFEELGTEQNALDAVLPLTMQKYSYDGRSTGFGLKVGFPTSSFDMTETKTFSDKLNENGIPF